MEDCGKDGLRVESMMNGECIQSMEEKDDEKKEVQYMLDLARAAGPKLNGGYSFIHLTLRMGFHVLGRKSIEQVVIWDQKAEQAVTFIMNGSNLRKEAEVWLPSGYGRQESKEELGVEKDGVKSTTTVVEEDTSTSTTLSDAGRLVEQKMSQETTAVETMSYERLAEAVDKQKAADDVEEGCEKEKGDVSKASEQKVLDECEADEGGVWSYDKVAEAVDEQRQLDDAEESDDDPDRFLPFDEHPFSKSCPKCRKLGGYCFACRRYREGEDNEEADIKEWSQELAFQGESIEKFTARFTDEIKPMVGVYPDTWSDGQRDKVHWYSIKLDGRAMYIARDSGAIDYISHLGKICEKKDSDVQMAIKAYKAAAAKGKRGFVVL